MSVFLKLQRTWRSWGTPDSDLVDLGWDLRVFISNKLPGAPLNSQGSRSVVVKPGPKLSNFPGDPWGKRISFTGPKLSNF